jgi:hypothetical protein
MAVNDVILRAHGDNFIFLECVRFIKVVKTGGTLAETSPMLHSICTSVPTWTKICTGLLRMFEAEVLGKLPVIQHLRFGTLIPCTWSPSRAAEAFGSVAPPDQQQQQQQQQQPSGATAGSGDSSSSYATPAPWTRKR